MDSSHYDVLNVSTDASQDDIKARYATILRELRARVRELGPSASTHLDRVRAAYLTLSDPAKRAAYDASIGVRNAAHAPGTLDSIGKPPARRAAPNENSIASSHDGFWARTWHGEETVRRIVWRLALPGWFLSTLLTANFESLKAALPSVWPVAVVPIAVISLLCLNFAVVGLWRCAYERRSRLAGHLVRALGLFVGLIVLGFASHLATISGVRRAEVASAPKRSNDTIVGAFQGFAHEGCDNPGFAFVQARSKKDADADAAYLKTIDGKYLAAALDGRLSDVYTARIQGADLNARDQRRRFAGNSALDHAARRNNVELARLLLSHGMDVNAQAEDGHTALHVATGLGKRRLAEYLLQNKANPDIAAKVVGTPLEVAVLQARPTMAKLLLKYGAGKNAQDRSSPLKSIRNAAVLCPGHQEIIKLLIDSGTDLFAEDSSGRSGATALVWRGDETAMILARNYPSIDWNSMVSSNKQRVPLLMVAKCASRAPDTIEYLLTAHPRNDLWRKSVAGPWGSLLHCPSVKPELDEMVLSLLPDVNVTDAEGKTPLHKVRDFRMIDALVKRGARLDVADKNGRTPLYEVIHHTSVLEKLLEVGADPLTEDDKGMTVLEHAVSSDAGAAVSILLQHSMDPNRRNREGRTPLHGAVYRATATVLIKRGADVHARDSDGLTPLHTLAARSADTAIEFLLAKGADAMARAKDGTIPLHHVRRHEAVPPLLKAHPGSVIALDLQGRMPIHYVGAHGTGATMRLLLDQAVDVVNAADDLGNTPLHLAVQGGSVYGVRYLVKFGANPALVNNEGKTPFDLVRNHPKAEELTKALRGDMPPR